MTININIEVDDRALTRVVSALSQQFRDLKPLHTLWGLAAIEWIDMNFRRGGSPRWKRVKRPGQPLRDQGRMAQSFVPRPTATEVTIGTSDEKAPWHHFGTRPHIIAARKGRALRIPIGFTPEGRRPTRGASNFIFRRRVIHPGSPARPLLPTREQILNEMKVVEIAQRLLENTMRSA